MISFRNTCVGSGELAKESLRSLIVGCGSGLRRLEAAEKEAFLVEANKSAPFSPSKRHSFESTGVVAANGGVRLVLGISAGPEIRASVIQSVAVSMVNTADATQKSMHVALRATDRPGRVKDFATSMRVPTKWKNARCVDGVNDRPLSLSKRDSDDRIRFRHAQQLNAIAAVQACGNHLACGGSHRNRTHI